MSNFDQQLEKIRSAKGFIAALDQSGGSTPKALLQYGVPQDAYSGDDEMFGDGGDDCLTGGDGTDQLACGDGNDTYDQGEWDFSGCETAGTCNCEPVGCVDIRLHCDANSSVLETVCGGGVQTRSPVTAANISFVSLGADVNGVILHHCPNGPLAGQTLTITGDTNLCGLQGGCCGYPRWNDEVCAIELF